MPNISGYVYARICCNRNTTVFTVIKPYRQLLLYTRLVLS